MVSPHPDVASGRYLQAEFAADLAQVLAGTAEAEYQDPMEFFRRTYLTEGLLNMLVTGVKRLTAQGGDPVVQLQTAFGGGKTHSMLALYHLSSGGVKLSDFVGGERIADRIGNVDLPEANRAVLVGTALDPARPRDYPDATTHTLWGELAYQLGGKEGYEMVATADQKGVSPNSDTLKELLDQFGPCLIIIDEFVAYARNIYHVDDLPAGTFASVMTFVQALTEAARRSDDSMLLISLPESDIEVGGEAGQEALECLAHVVGRIESVWKPVTATESFEIVRRRLFSSEVDYAARDAVLEGLQRHVPQQRRRVPLRCGRTAVLRPPGVRLSHSPGTVRPPLPGLVDAGSLPAHARRAALHGGRDPPAVDEQRSFAADSAGHGAAGGSAGAQRAAALSAGYLDGRV